jgi:hypothetical protein
VNKGYINALSRSICLAIEEFYQDIQVVSVSSLNGHGFGDFKIALDKSK